MDEYKQQSEAMAHLRLTYLKEDSIASDEMSARYGVLIKHIHGAVDKRFRHLLALLHVLHQRADHETAVCEREVLEREAAEQHGTLCLPAPARPQWY